MLHYWDLELDLPRLCVRRYWNWNNVRCHLPILEQSIEQRKRKKRGLQQKRIRKQNTPQQSKKLPKMPQINWRCRRPSEFFLFAVCFFPYIYIYLILFMPTCPTIAKYRVISRYSSPFQYYSHIYIIITYIYILTVWTYNISMLKWN
jgi:hypothetical protein